MASILLPCYTSFALSSLKKHKLHRYCDANYGSRNFVCKNNITSSFSSKNSVGVPLDEFPWASFDQYMEDKGRVIQAIFPEKSTTQRLNEEEWRVMMTPIQVLFLTCQPVIYITPRCISEDYPPEIPEHITKLFEIKITRCELQGLHTDYMPHGFKINAKGALYLERQGRHNWMKHQLDIRLSLAIPPLLAWVPDYVLQNILQSVLRNYAEGIDNGLAIRLLADYNSFKRSKPKNLM